jgi:hypothetical protein
MAFNSDWLSTKRAEQLAMASMWIEVCDPKKATWNIPQLALLALTNYRDAAEAALEAAKNESTRTPVANARCKAAFEELVACMRGFKNRYFNKPLLTDADLVSLGLKPHDNHPTPAGKPTAQVAVETYLAGRHQIGVRIVFVAGDLGDPANKGFHIWYLVVRPGETPPQSPDELRELLATKRHKDLLEFAFEDSGSTVYIAAQVVNGELKGGFGPMMSVLIP